MQSEMKEGEEERERGREGERESGRATKRIAMYRILTFYIHTYYVLS